MSSIKLKHSGGNSVIIAAPSSNPASDRTITLPSSANGTMLTSTSGSSLRVLEQFYLLADGRSVSTSNGTVTTTNVTGVQNLTDSFVEATGSSLTYQPPTGTTELIYEYKFMFDETNANDRYLFSYHVNIDGTVILESRGSVYTSGGTYNDYHYIKYGFRIGSGSDNATTGDRASWSTNKTIKTEIARYSSGYSADLHRLRYYQPNGNADNYTRRPYVGITAIGVPT